MKFTLKKINGIDFISGRELQSELGIKQDFTNWFKNQIDRAFLENEKDFTLSKAKSTGGRPTIDYLVTIESAKRISIVSHTKESKKIIDYLLSLDEKVENLELFTVKQAAFAIKIINCLKYVENQKEALKLHKKQFFDSKLNEYSNPENASMAQINSEFWKFREKLTGWNKEKVNEAINEYLLSTTGASKHLKNTDMSTQISAMDIGEAIRVAVLDILFSKSDDENLAKNFSNLCKNLANELKTQPEKTNSKNIYREVESIENVRKLSIDKM